MISLHLDTRPDWRGGQNQVLLTPRGLRARGHGVELMALEGGAIARRAQAEGFRVHTFPSGSVRLAGAMRLRKLLSENRFDIVHAHDPHGLTAAWLAGAHRRSALVIQRRVANPLSTSRLALARYRAARRIFAISRFVAQSLIDSGIAPALIDINYEGVDLPEPTTSESRRQARLRWSIAENEILLSCVGYLLPEKGQETLLRALPAVRERYRNVRLLLAGDGPCRRALEKLARDLHVESHVIFGGFLEDVVPVYRATDIFLFPSLTEPLGTSLLAAMAYGLPAVAVASGGVPEIVENGLSGLLVPASRAEDIAAALLGLLGDRERAARLGAAARDTIAQKFTADRMVEGTLEKYERILAELRR